MSADSTSTWAARSLARRNFILIGTCYSLGMLLTNLWFDKAYGSHSAVILMLVFLSLCYLSMTLVKSSTMLESEELVQPIFNFIVSAISLASCLYVLTIATAVLFQWESGAIGTSNAMVIDRLLVGQIPPALKMALTLPLQTIPMGMDISVAKRVTLVNLVIVCITILFIYLLERPEDAHSCQEGGETIKWQMFFVNDVLLVLYAISVACFSLVPGIQISDEYNKSLRAGRLADSVLGHILNNSVSGAAYLIEMEIEEVPTNRTRNTLHLTDALAQLRRTMEWFANRQILVDLSSAAYKSSVSAVCVSEFLASVVKSACAGKTTLFAVVDNTTEATRYGASLQFDARVTELALTNALSNAKKHGGGQPVELRASLVNAAKESSGAHLMFEVENLLVGDSLTDSELGVIKTEATSRSTNSGLYYISLACQAVLGAFDMRLGSKNGKKTMVLSISVPVVIEKPALELALPGSSELAISTPPVSAVESMPEGLKICMIDDSKIICKGYQRLLLPNLKADMDESVVVCAVSSACVDRFVKVVMGGTNIDEQVDGAISGIPTGQRAHVVILDQHIVIAGKDGETGVILGTNIAVHLREKGFRDLLMIRSANATANDIDGYMRSGAVDHCLGKDQTNKEVVREVITAYQRKVAALQTPQLKKAPSTPWRTNHTQRPTSGEEEVVNAVAAAHMFE